MSRVIAGLLPEREAGGRKVRTPIAASSKELCGSRATRLVTPGGCALKRAKVRGSGAATESATENQTAGELEPRRQANGETDGPPVSVIARLVRVKRWGKSPPPGWQHPGHGKPRVEQGQIGGEGWPSPYAACPACGMRGCDPRVGCLSLRSDPEPRGMIIARGSESFGATESGLQAHPRFFFMRIFRFRFCALHPRLSSSFLTSLRSNRT